MRALTLAVAVLMGTAQPAAACVGKTLVVGITATPEHQVLAALLSVLISERTGTSVDIREYPRTDDVYAAAATGDVGLLVERTDRAWERLGDAGAEGAQRDVARLKSGYKDRWGLVWNAPAEAGTALDWRPVLTLDIVNNFPALPRLVGKLNTVLNPEVLGRLVAAVQAGEKPRKVARDFLQTKRLI